MQTFSYRRLFASVAGLALIAVAGLAHLRAVHAASGASAPEIARPGLQWFNVANPLPIASLRGRVVILDFWTEGCINCIHIIPILRSIEQKYPEQVVVIGVHSPKFAEEKDASSVKDAIARYEIRHPIVHDPKMTIWNAYDVKAWPTLAIIGPDGSILGRIPGEPDPERFGKAIGDLVAQASQSGDLKPAKLALQLEETTKGRFLFPGKLKSVRGANAQWALADAGHNQIVLLDDAGRDLRRFGSGQAGFKDGAADVASFDHPQGLIASNEAIFVADTGNHAIRRIDLKTGAVTTLAGTGKRGSLLPTSAQSGKTSALASPWDLEKKGDQLFFANAGTHQIGVVDLAGGTVARFAGSGDEALQTGLPAEAAFAQPSGLALSKDGATLYVADAESSAIRAINLEARDRTWTVVGTGLFDFGRVDGAFSIARLQHPLGVAVDGERLLVADTYNSRVRTLDLKQKTVSEFDGGKYTCTDPICYPTREPAGIAVATPDRILLVDTGNHRVEEFQPSTKTSRTWAR
ncbi:MAG: redoxin domain-containing protein [Rudaea sp.]|uniref:thioredoxin-like domain-containing protein n=1 Tax=unclassified Rudaea TaxID=2627037 RepID=UPI0010F808C6|nr:MULTISPECIES: thioredoxin-like domain-containing protein [unclassified Rudaea]MBN8885676.1 redoxin domain-containing protein [Rudaea sp.]MBR0346388.1 redoxin domain-containing protein [Rudaea sp.]